MGHGQITVKYLQDYIRSKDFRPDEATLYYMKLSEEVGELARAMRKDLRPTEASPLKETIDEELWDIMYYVVALANCYGIDLEQVIPAKEALNNRKYETGITFDPGK